MTFNLGKSYPLILLEYIAILEVIFDINLIKILPMQSRDVHPIFSDLGKTEK